MRGGTDLSVGIGTKVPYSLPFGSPSLAGRQAQAPTVSKPHNRRVLIADDHYIVAEGIARLLSELFDIVEIVEDGEALVQAAQSLEVDVVIADVAMPRWSGLRALKTLRALGSQVPFVFLTMHSEPAVVAAAMRAGANGYVLKARAGRELLFALETVMSGQPYVTPSLAAEHLTYDGLPTNLTERQHSILVLIAKGKGTKQIAKELNLSTRTVEAHRYTLMQMFHVHTAIELVRKADALGLLVIQDIQTAPGS